MNNFKGSIYFIQKLENNDKRNFETKLIVEVLWVLTTVYVTHQHSYSVNVHPVTCELHVGLTYLYWRQPIWNIII